jgi:UPF0716 protein FxsA
MWLFALILGLPLVEIALYVTLGAWLGLWITLGIVIGTALGGILLIRSQGARAGVDLRAAMMARQNPAPALAADAFRVIAGVLLILPGFLTDALGLLLLVPPLQRWLVAAIARRAGDRMATHVRAGMWDAATTYRDRTRPDIDIIDATWEELPDAPEAKEGGSGSGWTRH